MPTPTPLLILDLDETLIHATREPLDRPADFRVDVYHVYRRPHLDAFLGDMSTLYRVAIWSSAGDDYVADIASHLADGGALFEFVWGGSRGTLRRDIDKNEWYYAKDLARLSRRGEDIRRMLIVDDEPRKLAKNYGNAIYVREFLGNPSDDELRILGRYLTVLRDQPNYRRIEKRRWRERTIHDIRQQA